MKLTKEQETQIIEKFITRRCPFCGAPSDHLAIKRGTYRYSHCTVYYVHCKFCEAKGPVSTCKSWCVFDWNHIGNKRSWTSVWSMKPLRQFFNNVNAAIDKARAK